MFPSSRRELAPAAPQLQGPCAFKRDAQENQSSSFDVTDMAACRIATGSRGKSAVMKFGVDKEFGVDKDG